MKMLTPWGKYAIFSVNQGWVISKCGRFDFLNTAMWDDERQVYHCYHRGFHADRDGMADNCRDIRHMISRDFHEWSEATLLDFMGKEDYQLYTNSISVYQRAPQILVGFPTRYAERREWTANYDRLGGTETQFFLYKTGIEGHWQ